MQTPREGNTLENKYNEAFFQEHRKNGAAYTQLATFVQNQHPDTTIVDIGCGHGLLVEEFRKAGLDAYGIEGSRSAMGMWPQKHKAKYTVYDLTDKSVFDAIPKTEKTSLDFLESCRKPFFFCWSTLVAPPLILTTLVDPPLILTNVSK